MGETIRTIQFWRGRLPHWEVVDGRYFVTMRLANCLPRQAAERLRALAVDGPDDAGRYLEWSRRYFAVQEQLLHRQPADALLGRPEVAEKVLAAARYYDEAGKWRLSALTILPNHIHLFVMAGAAGMTKVMRDFKHATARAVKPFAGDGAAKHAFWQQEWFDHWSRSALEDDKIRLYIRDNAVKAGLVRSWRDWPWLWLREE